MDAADKEQPDESSIRPVSSLRSHFEGIRLTTPTPSVPILSRPTSAIFSPPAPPEVRANTKPPSLKPIPPPPRLSKSRTPSRSSTPALEGEATPIRTQVNASSVDWPASSALQVHVTSPASPPKSEFKSIRSKQDEARTLPATPHAPQTDDTLIIAHSHGTHNQQLRPGNNAESISRSDVRERPKSIPPPVNRGSKPVLENSGLVLPTHNRKASSVSIDPREKSSPFGTPPSSNDPSPEKEDPPPIPHHLKPTKPFTSVPSGPPALLGFEPPPTHHTMAGKRRGREASLGQDSRPQPLIGSVSKNGSDTPESRPGLPPRRETASRPISSIQIPTRPADQPLRQTALSQGFASRSGPSQGLGKSMPVGRVDQSNRQQRLSRVEPTYATISGSNHQERSSIDDVDSWQVPNKTTATNMPDRSRYSRRPPFFADSPRFIATGYDLRTMDTSGEFVCVSGAMTRVWSVLTGKLIFSIAHGENIRVSSVAFKPTTKVDLEGTRVWIGTNWGEIQEIDVVARKTVAGNSQVHSRRQVIKFYRQGIDLWSLDDEGKLYYWPAQSDGTPNLTIAEEILRVPRGHTASTMNRDKFWIASGKEINVFSMSPSHSDRPQLNGKPLVQVGTGDAVSAAVISTESASTIYFGHTDGRISAYNDANLTCIRVVHVSGYKIGCLAAVNGQLWAGDNNGQISVFETRSDLWELKKEWSAHDTPVVSLVTDTGSLWKLGCYNILSLGVNNTVGIWDGMLETDWLETYMRGRMTRFCSFKEVSALTLTWNVGASKPTDLRHSSDDASFLGKLFKGRSMPDVVTFGLQELVDLEDKSLTAKSFFKSKHRRDDGQEHLSRTYRAWRDYLTECLDVLVADGEPYSLLHTSSMVGLFLCVFVRDSLRRRIRDVSAAEVKTGMGGLHGNKGALIVRFLMDDTSICFANCHLAAGQTHTQHRNLDVASILDVENLPVIKRPGAAEIFASGGDGSMMMDHEICVINGDLNYRIDAMTRDTVIHAIEQKNYTKLLDRDQLLLSCRKTPTFRLRAFTEAPITFAPTYKYDVGSDTFDSSEKRRVPAWCDRILYRGGQFATQTEYSRHTVRVSDHRPVTARFRFRVKTIDSQARAECLAQGQVQFAQYRSQLSRDTKLSHLMHVFGLSQSEAQAALDRT